MTTLGDQDYVWELGRVKDVFLHAITALQMSLLKVLAMHYGGRHFLTHNCYLQGENKNKQKLKAKYLSAPFLLGSFRSSVGTISSCKEPTAHPQEHEDMTVVEGGEQGHPQRRVQLVPGSRVFLEHMPWLIFYPIV